MEDSSVLQRKEGKKEKEMSYQPQIQSADAASSGLGSIRDSRITEDGPHLKAFFHISPPWPLESVISGERKLKQMNWGSWKKMAQAFSGATGTEGQGAKLSCPSWLPGGGNGIATLTMVRWCFYEWHAVSVCHNSRQGFWASVVR